MKNHLLEVSEENSRISSRGILKFGMMMIQAGFLGFSAVTTGYAEEPAADDQNAQVLTRGPIHEAFAGIVSYNPEPGVIVEKAPPEPIEELPPDERPTGENITWIPGYWAWDDERSDFLWISGTWRALPPGRQWTSGYWTEADNGYQWISGYWADSSVEEVTYLPKPPETVESGPNVEAPSRDHSWSPGYWVWQQERYAWRPGYWAVGRSDWDWVPAHYVWTPRGYVFVEGYWDYNFNRRGILYAPVYFRSDYYARPGYSYSPVIAIGLTALVEHLFLRPRYHHYYFGDYYDRRYRDHGYYSPYVYHSSRYGYDPVYSYRRWTHRQDRNWERRFEEAYEYRRDHESARPPRTWADQRRLKLDSAEAREQQLMMASPVDQMVKRKDSSLTVQRVPDEERRKLADVSREVRKNREQRRTLETEGAKLTAGRADREIKPTKAKLPTSPIVGKAPDRFSKKDAPPQRPTASGNESAPERPDRRSDLERPGSESKGQPGSRETETNKEQKTPRKEREAQREPRERDDTPPQTRKPQGEQPDRSTDQQPRQESPSKVREPERRPQKESGQRQETPPQTRRQQSEPERRVEQPQRQEAPPKVREPERRPQQQPTQREEAPPKVREPERRPQQQPTQRQEAPPQTRKPQPEPERRVQQPQRQEAPSRAREPEQRQQQRQPERAAPPKQGSSRDKDNEESSGKKKDRN